MGRLTCEAGGEARPAATTSKSIPMWISARRRRKAFISDPPDGKIPYQPWALATRAEHRAASREDGQARKERLYTDPQTYCLYTVPRATYRGGFEIMQGAGYVLIAFNFGHYYRFIPRTAVRTRSDSTSNCGWGIRAVPGMAIRWWSMSPT
jgi:hypothetical protein